MRVSIAMATFNGERFIREQLNSLSRQTLLPYELVVCHDGSADCTLDLIAEHAKTAPFPVRLHHNDERLGYRNNFLKAASLCTGELIAFCDQDVLYRDLALLYRERANIYEVQPRLQRLTKLLRFVLRAAS